MVLISDCERQSDEDIHDLCFMHAGVRYTPPEKFQFKPVTFNVACRAGSFPIALKTTESIIFLIFQICPREESLYHRRRDLGLFLFFLHLVFPFAVGFPFLGVNPNSFL